MLRPFGGSQRRLFMSELTSKQRVVRMLKREPIDRIPAFESFWADTQGAWADQGKIDPDVSVEDHFDLDMRTSGAFNVVGNLDFEQEIIEETEDTILARNGNGALLRRWKSKSGTPEHVDFMVKDRASWEEHIRPHLVNTDNYRRRIEFEIYRKARDAAVAQQKYFCWSGLNVFELMHPVCGHEYMLMGMALDPDWVKDMCTVYSQMLIDLLEILFAEVGIPDGMWFLEDMGFKQKPFMSPQMYKDIVWPAHKRLFDFSHSHGLDVIVHSCGFVEPLIPGLIEAGMDCLQALEIKAGMDLIHLKKTYGDSIAFIGGMDIRTLETNDTSVVEAELQKNLPIAMAGGGYCLHSDHSISSRIEYDTYRYFLDRGREIGAYD